MWLGTGEHAFHEIQLYMGQHDIHDQHYRYYCHYNHDYQQCLGIVLRWRPCCCIGHTRHTHRRLNTIISWCDYNDEYHDTDYHLEDYDVLYLV